MEMYKLKESEVEVTVLVGVGSAEELGTQQVETPGMRAAKISDSTKGE